MERDIDGLTSTALPALTTVELHTATTFEEHMRPDVVWFEDPRYAEEFSNLARADTLPLTDYEAEFAEWSGAPCP